MFETLPIQVGLDLATALSVLGACLAYIHAEKQKRLEQRKREDSREHSQRTEMAYRVVDEVLNFNHELHEVAKEIHHLVLQTTEETGSNPKKFANVAAEINRKLHGLLDRLEFTLLRPLEVRVETVGGTAIWQLAREELEVSLNTLERAFSGLQKVCDDEHIDSKTLKDVLSQAVPMLYGKEKIGDEIHTLHSALIQFSRTLGKGLRGQNENKHKLPNK